MNINNINQVKDLYNKGFRCIKYEEHDNGEFKAYFKNFEEEKIDSLSCKDKKEVGEIKSFIDSYQG
ncbi:hypothetical protein [Dethiothermospora halolimnae]|uniref:hypothetical protein n=1 Tax=Dethiothermospora halolimnae TaxID=3114390 RepID=UPI003CCBD5A4